MALFPVTHCDLRQIEGEKLRIGNFSFTIAIKLVLIAFIEREMGLTTKKKKNHDPPSIQIWILKYHFPV